MNRSHDSLQRFVGAVTNQFWIARFPAVPRTIVLVKHRKTSQLRIILALGSTHLVNHHVEGRNHIDTVSAGPGFPIRIPRRTLYMAVLIHIEIEAMGIVRI